MTIVSMSRADADTVGEIRRLEGECRARDGFLGKVSLDPSLQFDPSIDSVFLGYEGGRLVAFLSLFIPTPHEAEVTGMTLPAFRRQGRFTRLLREAARGLERHGIGEMLLECEDMSADGLAAVRKLDAHYEFTELMMRYSRRSDPYRVRARPACRLVPASAQDLNRLAAMDALIFDTPREESEKMIRGTLASPVRRQYLLTNGGESVGLAAVCFGEAETPGAQAEAMIYGLGVLPAYRGRGFGNELVWLVTRRLLRGGWDNILLEVDSSNTVARRLYAGCGFERECAIVYYRLHTSRLLGGPKHDASACDAAAPYTGKMEPGGALL